MSDDKVLCDKDIDNIWRSIKSVFLDDALLMIKNRIVVKPRTISNSYYLSNDERKEYHLSIYNPLRIVNFEIAVAMTA